MNVLFLADPNSIHDIKWISYFADKGLMKAYLLPRVHHWKNFSSRGSDLNVTILPPIKDFSVVRFYQTIVTAIQIRKILRNEKIDLINIHYAEPNALWCAFRWYFKVPMIVTALGTDVLITIPKAFKRKDVLNRVVAFLYKYAFKCADWVTGTSRAQLESVRRFSGRKNNTSIIRTGVDMKRLMADTSEYFPLSDQRSFILFPRYIAPVYNHEFCVAAIAMLPQEIKKKYKMVFVGKHDDKNEYQAKLQRLMALQSDVAFEFIAGQSQESIFELYKRASLVVMTPVSDGSPVSGMEALLCGAKLILGPLDYDTDIFSHAKKLTKWSEAELAGTITEMLSDANKFPELPADAKRAADREYNMQQMLTIYRRLSDKE